MFAGIISRDHGCPWPDTGMRPIGYDGHGAPLYEWQVDREQ
jgi:hypothetical protein